MTDGDPGARAGRDRTRRDGDPRANERPAPRHRGRARGGRDPVPRPRRAVLRATRGPPRDAGRRPRSPASQSEEPLVARLSAAFERELGVRRDTVPEGEAAARAPRRGRHAPRTGRGARPGRDPDGRRAGLPRRGRATGRDRGRRDRDRRRAPDLPPGQGPRMGRGLPAGTRGGHAADPPVDRAGRAGRGTPPALRRDHPGTALPVAVVGHDADGGDGTRRPAQPLAVPRRAGATVGPPVAVAETAGPGQARQRTRRSTRPTGRRSRMRSVPGARPVPEPTPSPRSSSSTTRPSRPSRPAARARSRSCAASRASAR